MNALNSFIGQKERPQVVRTPTNILDAVDQTFGVNRWVDVYPDPGSEATRRGAGLAAGFDAHRDVWPWRPAFANPEYKGLELPMRTCAKHEFGCIMLIPARPRREWWCRELLGSHVAWLKPVTFVGYPGSNPENMVAALMGGITEDDLYYENFYLAFKKLSNHIAPWK